MASALARRASGQFARRSSNPPARRSSPPKRKRSLARRAGAHLAKRAKASAASAVKRAQSDVKVQAALYGTLGAAAGAFAEVKVPQIPQIPHVPTQAAIGAVGTVAGIFLPGKLGAGVLFASLGPLFAGVSSMTKQLASGGTLAGDDTSYGPGPAFQVAGEFDDIAR